MNKKFTILVALLLSVSVATVTGSCQTKKPPSASSILVQALHLARASQKNVFLVFHASWCPWCKRLDALLGKPDVSKIVNGSFVVTRVDVMERGEKKLTLENPGGNEMMKRFGGEKSGLPYYVFLNEDGKMIGNSNVMPDGQNIGYPGSGKEDSTFVALLKRTARNITGKQLEVIERHLKSTSAQ